MKAMSFRCATASPSLTCKDQMESRSHQQLHIFFFPFMAPGHMIPTIDTALLFASRGLKSTIITTDYNAPLLSKTIENSKISGTQINILTLKFPSLENGLPEGCESLHKAAPLGLEQEFFKATTTLGPQLDQLLQHHRPHCLVADIFFPWATDVAAQYGIPRLVFYGTCYFSLCAFLCVYRFAPHEKVSSDSEPFLIPNFPGDIKFTRNQILDFPKEDVETNVLAKLFKEAQGSEERSYGVLVNSFYELEPVYADHYKKGLGVKAWHIGPLFLYKKLAQEKGKRGTLQHPIDEHECLKWLNTKNPNSVIYICFGSLADFNDAQLVELALGLEASGKEFIWVVKKEKQQGTKEEWLPDGFEKRMEGKGVIVRGWAPQVPILEHQAIGGFVTHCGWNSILEGVCAGVSMVTWPVAAEQFYNEKLVNQILGIGVGVGAEKCATIVKREAIEKAVGRIMEGEEAEQMKSRAKALGEMATRAIEEGGSSYLDLNKFIDELMEVLGIVQNVSYEK